MCHNTHVAKTWRGNRLTGSRKENSQPGSTWILVFGHVTQLIHTKSELDLAYLSLLLCYVGP